MMNQKEEIAPIRQQRNRWLGKWIPAILLAIASYFPLFLHLDVQPIQNYDEGFFALRAFSLAHYNKYLYNFKELPLTGSATNTKPPLFSWVQAFFFKTLGYNELSLRLPVALTVVLLLFLMVRFCAKEFGEIGWGYFSALVLVTSWGFVNMHVSRSGDHDAPLALFGITALLYYYKYLKVEDRKEQQKYLAITTLALICSTLTKSVAGMFFGPAILLYTVYKKKLKTVLSDPYTWICAGAFLLLVGGQYLYRELDHPGFFRSIWKNELAGHYAETRDFHSHPATWYIERIFKLKFTYWLGFIPFGLYFLFHPKNKSHRDFTVMTLIAFCTWLGVISFSETKLDWYDASLYPLMAFWVGFALYQAFQGLVSFPPIKNYGYKYLVTGAMIFAIFLTPYQAIIKKVYWPKDLRGDGEMYGYLIKQLERTHPQYKNYCILHLGHTFHSVFYRLVYNETKNKDYKIYQIAAWEHAIPGDTIMACQPKVVNYLKETFHHEILSGYNDCKLIYLSDYVKPKDE